MKKRILAVVLCLCMVVGMAPTALAAAPRDLYAAAGGATRYTVLVLDTSSTSGFVDKNEKNFYTADTAVPYVKAAAMRFVEDIQKADGTNYVAIVSYTGKNAPVISGFTTDSQKLNNAINSLKSSSDHTRSVAAGLKSAEDLIDSVGSGTNITKNVVLFTTGMTNDGDYSYSGHYSENTVGSTWRRVDTDIKLYAYSNVAYAAAEAVKAKANLYTVGLFQTMDDMPAQGEAIVKFFKLFARDCASTPNHFYDVKDPDDLTFTFGEVAGDIKGWDFANGVLVLRSDDATRDYTQDDPAPWSEYADQITEVVIHNSVTYIGVYTFAGCSNLEFIRFPYSVQAIGKNAFANCPKISMICLPSGLVRIGASAFKDCAELETVLYAGSKSQWEKIDKGSGIFPSTFRKNVRYGSYLEGRPVPTISLDDIDLTWDVDSLKTVPSTKPDPGLAALGAVMSKAINDPENGERKVKELLAYVGCNENEIEPYNFKDDNDEQVDQIFKPATTIGHMVISDVYGNEEDVIFVVCRGTTTTGDILTDIFAALSLSGFTRPALDVRKNLEDFCQTHHICNKLSDYKGKFILLGHSLGGATVATLGKTLTDDTEAGRVYCYTIGSPRSSGAREIDHVIYGNIHNYINRYDDVPNWGYGSSWIGPTYKLDYKDPNFSRFDELYKKLTGDEKGYDYTAKGSTLTGQPGVPHDPDTYISYLLCNVSNLTPAKYYPTVVRIACPVDVEVTNSEGRVVGRVVDNTIRDYLPLNYAISVEDGVKTIVFANEGEYTINIVGTGEGTMDYSVTKYDAASDKALSEKKYENVAITQGKRFTSEVRSDSGSSEPAAQQTALYVLNAAGTPTKEVLPDGKGTEVPYAAVKFTDVPSGAWYYDAVYWAIANGITNGTGNNRFSPDRTCSHVEIITFLWRAAGKPEAAAAAPFNVASYYVDAVNWAYSEKIIGDSFRPDAPCTRSDTVTYMWKYSGSPIVGSSAFADLSADAPYRQAVNWAVASGVTTGTGDSTFSPAQTCNRAQIVTFLRRLITNRSGHRYQYIVDSCSWTQAHARAREAGGYLVRIDSLQEYAEILSGIHRQGLTNVEFRIGARRASDGKDYHWVDEHNAMLEGVINASGYWACPEWLAGEPSYEWAGHKEEFISIYLDKDTGVWVWNDVADQVYRPGKSTYGYIVEFDS